MPYAPSMAVSMNYCTNCKDCLEHDAKFCGNCGFIIVPASFNINQYPQHAAALIDQATFQVPDSVPNFARMGAPAENPRNKELSNEASKIMVLLARERIFLYMHWIGFIAINIFGCWIAWKCYTDFIGDEMSKTMIASTPFLFINSVALLFLVPIKGTRSEIARLKERLSCVRFNIEFGHLDI
jgi:hypothetical protein